MKQSPLRRTPMKPGKPMQRGGPLLRTAWKRKQRRVSAQAQREYERATERARDPEGWLRCERCHLPIAPGDDHRHHVGGRVTGTHAERLLILHSRCHMELHGERFSTQRSARSFSGGGSFGVALSSESQARGLPSRE